MRPRAHRWLVVAVAAAAGCKVQPVLDNAAGPQEDLAQDAEGRAADGTAASASRKYKPLGHAGDASSAPGLSAEDRQKDTVPVPDRWRVGLPAWERGSQSDSPYDMSTPIDPYHQNVWKGDYPILGSQNTFLLAEIQSITKLESKKLPIPPGVFPRDANSEEFFGNGHIRTAEEIAFLTLDLFWGETSFKPVDFRILVKGAIDGNYAHAEENTVLFADPSRGATRTDRHSTLQQGFIETTPASVSDKYDVVQLRAGIQKFNSDFRGFMFEDENLGARLFGNLDDNRWQWNLAYFDRLNKDTNSGLNTFDRIGQHVFLANVYRQDVLTMLTPTGSETTWNQGLTTQLSWHYLDTEPSVHYDENGFLVRPRLIGTVEPHGQNVHWLGWTNDGHIGRVNVTSALYGAFGEVDLDEIAGSSQDVSASLAVLELSYDRDWMRFRIQGLWQSGDGDPQDGDAEGFDAIFDNENFGGGEFSFWNRNAIGLSSTGVGLKQGGSLYNTLRSSKIEGNPAFVNPGLLLLGVGYDAQLTPHLKLIFNANHLVFDDTSSLEYALGQGSLDKEIGEDISLGLIWRPLLTENVIVKGGVSALVPGDGFRDIYGPETLYSVFTELILTW
jgi:hypothetical protein